MKIITQVRNRELKRSAHPLSRVFHNAMPAQIAGAASELFAVSNMGGL